MTSAVTSTPRALAQRSTSTVSAVDTWQTCRRDRVSSASWTSRATMPASATAGQPGSPSRPETGPSSQQASRPASRGSCACWATTPSKARTYSSARRISRASDTQCPSSENTRVAAAERAISPSSASSSPARPLLTAPIGTTCADPLARPTSSRCSAASAVSVTGEVLAMASTAVKPPRAAAAVPDATVSASSRPGSRRWVCRSTRPGSATSPYASTRRAPGRTSAGSTNSPSRISRSAGPAPARSAPCTRTSPMSARHSRAASLSLTGALLSCRRRRRAAGRARSSVRRPRRRPGRG